MLVYAISKETPFHKPAVQQFKLSNTYAVAEASISVRLFLILTRFCCKAVTLDFFRIHIYLRNLRDPSGRVSCSSEAQV